MIDIFILIVTAWAVFSGWRNGLLKEVASTVGFLVGLIIAATCYSSFGRYLAVDGSEGNMMSSLVAFFLLWIATPIVLGLVANVLTKVLDNLHLGGINRSIGAVLSLLKFTILLSCMFSAMSALHILSEERAADSYLYNPVKSVVSHVVDYVFDTPDEVQQFTPADRPTTAADDTLWVEVPKH